MEHSRSSSFVCNACRGCVEYLLSSHSTIGDCSDIKDLDEWRSVSVQEVKYNGGREWLKRYAFYSLRLLIIRYNGSLMEALKDVYPWHNWPETRQRKPPGYWNSPEHSLQFIKSLEQKLSTLSLYSNCDCSKISNL